MITIEQCRGARGLLGWTQQDLADASCLSKTAINNFEKGNSDMKAESLKSIRRAFEAADIEFELDIGVRKRRDHAEIFSGSVALEHLMDDIAITLDQTQGDILIIQGSGATAGEDSGTLLADSTMRSRLTLLSEQEHSVRIICSAESAPLFTKSNNSNVKTRLAPASSLLGATTSFIYGSKLALQLWNQNIIILIDSPAAHDSEVSRFETIWESAAKTHTKAQSA